MENKNIIKPIQKDDLKPLNNAITRFSEFSKWWSSINLIILSGFFIGINIFIKDVNLLSLKLLLLFVYLNTIVLCNIMAINYLALEKAARHQFDLVKNDTNLKINWNNVKVKKYFFKALKSWAIFIPLLIYLCYFLYLIILLIIY